MADYQIIAYRPEFKEQVVALYCDAFQLKPGECREYLEWKHERNPYLPEPLLFLARDGRGSLVGMRGFYGTCWTVAGRRVVIPCADDFAIAPGERNKGLMTALMRVANEELSHRGFDLLMNASGGIITVLQSLAMGWQSLGGMEPFARLTVPERIRRVLRHSADGKPLVWRLARESHHAPSSCFPRLDAAGRNSRSRGGSVVVEPLPRPEAMAMLADHRPRDGRVAHVRDAAFFRWRFDNPLREYRFLFCDRDDVMAGFLVVARSRHHRPEKLTYNVVDWEGLTDDVAADLLHKALAWGRFAAIGTWTASLSASRRRMLTDHDFRPSDPELRARGMPCVLLKKISPRGPDVVPINGSAWDIRLIDSMHG